MLLCQGQRGGGSGEGTFLPLNFHLYLSVPHRGHPAVYQSLSWWWWWGEHGSFTFSYQNHFPMGQLPHSALSGAPLAYSVPNMDTHVGQTCSAEKSSGFWENDPLQPMPGWSPPPVQFLFQAS